MPVEGAVGQQLAWDAGGTATSEDSHSPGFGSPCQGGPGVCIDHSKPVLALPGRTGLVSLNFWDTV